jgi:hypothetical protein
LTDAAQGELPDHEIFRKPFEVKPQFEMWKTPKNYRYYPGGKDLPDKLKVWRVQNVLKKIPIPPYTGKNVVGVVSAPDQFAAKNSEILVRGYNYSKGFRAVAIGRYRNLLQWGFFGSPNQMTDAGKKLFINCVFYISKYDQANAKDKNIYDY